MGNYTKLAACLVLASMALAIEASTQPLHCAGDRTLGLSRIIEIEMRQFNLTLKDLETKPLTKHRKGA